MVMGPGWLAPTIATHKNRRSEQKAGDERNGVEEHSVREDGLYQ